MRDKADIVEGFIFALEKMFMRSPDGWHDTISAFIASDAYDRLRDKTYE